MKKIITMLILLVSGISSAQTFDFNCSSPPLVETYLSNNLGIYRLVEKNGWYEITNENINFYQCTQEGLQTYPIIDPVGGNILQESTFITGNTFVNVSIEVDGRREFILNLDGDYINITFRRYDIDNNMVEDVNDRHEIETVGAPDCADLVGFIVDPTDATATPGTLNLLFNSPIVASQANSEIQFSLAPGTEVPDNHYVQYNVVLTELNGDPIELDPVSAIYTTADNTNNYLRNQIPASRFRGAAGSETNVTITYEFVQESQIVIESGTIDGVDYEIEKSYTTIGGYNYKVEFGTYTVIFYSGANLGSSNSVNSFAAIGDDNFTLAIDVNSNSLFDTAAVPSCEFTSYDILFGENLTWRNIVKAIPCN